MLLQFRTMDVDLLKEEEFKIRREILWQDI